MLVHNYTFIDLLENIKIIKGCKLFFVQDLWHDSFLNVHFRLAQSESRMRYHGRHSTSAFFQQKYSTYRDAESEYDLYKEENVMFGASRVWLYALVVGCLTFGVIRVWYLKIYVYMTL